VHALRLRRQRNDAVHVRAAGDELAFALVPVGEDLGGRRAAQDARVD
jgi:hypothetical protein